MSSPVGPAAVAKVSYLFPGQGSQHVGMGKELYESSPAARALLQEVDESLGVSLTHLMFEGPEVELTQTVNAQPAILSVSLGYLKAMEEKLGPESMPSVAFMAGHSLGEYTSLAASSALDLGDAVRLVRERGRLMQEASQSVASGMAAVIGLDEMVVEEVCRETGAKICNVNAEDQVVIGGDHVTLARAMDLASARGARRLIRLQVSGAFHTALMEPAVPGMATALAQIRFKDPVVPVIANCSGLPITAGHQIKEELLEQICTCVQWRRSVDYLLAAGVNTFYEIGPGRVLSQLLRRADSNAQVTNVSSLEAIEGLVG